MLLKVSDFDIAKPITAKTSIDTVKSIYTYNYASPQQIDEEKSSFKHDWWAVGVICFRLFSEGNFPFTGDNQITIVKKIADRNLLAPELLPTIPQEIREICKGLLNKDESQRFDFEKILSYKYIRQEI